jgi:Trk K+ transport system NAD-binding subunit
LVIILARDRLLWQLGLVMTSTQTPRIAAVLQRGRSTAWSVPLVPAVAVTAYLAWGAWVSARHPSWLYQDGAWWRVWLRPDHDGLLVAFVVLWLLSALLFWWPRRRQSEDAGLIVVAAMVVIGAVLGTASLAPCRDGQARSAVVSWVLSLYVGALEPRYGPGTTCPGQLPLALQMGRTVCLGATLVGALAAAAMLWRQPVARIRVRLVKDATILTGLDAMTISLLHRLTSAGRPASVVVIEPDRNHPLQEEARRTGAQVVVADPRSPQVLLPLLRGLRGPQLRYLFALRPEATDNEAVLAAARHALGHVRADPDRPPHLIARIDDPRHAAVWRGQRVGGSQSWFEDALSPQESTARTLVNQVFRTGARQVLLCGDSTVALAILLELARCAWERGGLAAAAAGTAEPAAVGYVMLLDRRARDLRREYLATSSSSIIEALPEVKVHEGDWRDHLLPLLDALAPGQAGQTAVLIADTPTDASLHESGRVARLHPGTPVFVLISDGAGVSDAVFDKLQPFQRTFLVDGRVPEDSWTRIARHWHETYRLAHPAAPGGKKELTRRPWAELDDFIREDNILQLRSVMAAVVRRGRRWAPGRTVVPGSFVELSDGELHQVAREEHERWYRRRQHAGWRPPPKGGEDDDTLRLNRNVRPWDELPQASRARACQQVRSELAQLEAVGYMPVLPDDGPEGAASFRRVGEVRAERLVAGMKWRNASGDELSAAAGDWLVVDECGDERTVREEEFHASHEHLHGNRWRRVGAVQAWRVAEATAVRTIEGTAVARPGDWIVQGCGGERWPIGDVKFRRGYVSAGT